MRFRFFLSLWIYLLTISCGQENSLPKPRSYPRVDFPNKIYKEFEMEHCPMTFSMPQYSTIIKDQQYFETALDDVCWFDIDIKEFNCKIHCSYYEINETTQFEKLLTDAFKLAGKHTIKADYIDEHYFVNQFGNSGFVFELTGPVASPYQFFITDSTQHFLRGALYFETKARPDSLAPITDFVKKDIDILIQTLDWN